MLNRITEGVRNGLGLVMFFFTREQSESATNYVELNTPRQREQPQYEELDQRHTQRHNGRHQSNNYENAAAAAAQ